MQCTAKSKRSGERCKRHASPGMNVCYMHGGKSPRGMASASFKHGRYSKDLPTRLAGRYQEAVQDTRLLELRDEIALVDSRLGDLLARVDSGEAGLHWQRLHATWDEFSEAQRAKDTEGAGKAINELGRLIQRGASDYAAWHEVGIQLEQRRKLVESERKRLVEMQQMVTAERAMILLAAIVDVIRRHVSDKDALMAISADIRKLTAIESSG